MLGGLAAKRAELRRDRCVSRTTVVCAEHHMVLGEARTWIGRALAGDDFSIPTVGKI